MVVHSHAQCVLKSRVPRRAVSVPSAGAASMPGLRLDCRTVVQENILPQKRFTRGAWGATGAVGMGRKWLIVLETIVKGKGLIHPLADFPLYTFAGAPADHEGPYDHMFRRIIGSRRQ